MFHHSRPSTDPVQKQYRRRTARASGNQTQLAAFCRTEKKQLDKMPGALPRFLDQVITFSTKGKTGAGEAGRHPQPQQ
jgi:hypothetical protein